LTCTLKAISQIAPLRRSIDDEDDTCCTTNATPTENTYEGYSHQ
jgi:hypothetical protein